MIERGEDFGLALKAGEPLAIVRDVGRQYFQRDVTFELRVPRAVDLAHAAGAQGREDFVRAEADAGANSDV